jgi:hypothetical protein
MTVRELIKELLAFNLDADVSVYVNNAPFDFDFMWGIDHEGIVTKKDCTDVNLMVEYFFKD